jgi:hypothetical protein
LEHRQTFFDEALLVHKPKRELELATKWNIPFGNLLDFAVSHELGHASAWNQTRSELSASVSS